MSRPAVTLRVHGPQSLPSPITLHAGDLIGRLSTATLHINNPHISEAHALLSLRGDQLVLLGLRGPLRVGGQTRATLPLELGMRVELAEGIELEVVEIQLPELGLALAVGDEAPVLLSASVYSVQPGNPPRLAAGFAPNAVAQVWSDAASFFIAAPGGEPEEIRPGAAWILSGVPVLAQELPLRAASTPPTIQHGRLSVPLTIVLRFDSAEILRKDEETLTLSGLPARLFCELYCFGAPTLWSLVASEVWRGGEREETLRSRWDRTLSTLRSRLREASVRTDLVRADGTGRFELYLRAGDQVIDEM